MQTPESRQYQWVINSPRACPDPVPSERTNNARILRQMRFIVPDEAGITNACVCSKNEGNQRKRPQPLSLEERSSCVAQFAERRRVGKHWDTQLTTDTAEVAEKKREANPRDFLQPLRCAKRARRATATTSAHPSPRPVLRGPRNTQGHGMYSFVFFVASPTGRRLQLQLQRWQMI